MKKIFVLLLLAPLSLLAQNRSRKFTISGTISNYAPAELKEYIQILYMNGNEIVKDSVKLINNKFIIKGNLEENTLGILKFTKNKIPKEVFLTAANIKIDIAGENIKVTNSLAHIEYEKFKTITKSAFQTSDSLREVSQTLAANPAFKEKLNKKIAGDTSMRNDNDIKNYESFPSKFIALMKETNSLYATYLQQNPNTAIISYLIAGYSLGENNKAKLNEFYSFIGNRSRKLNSVKNFYAKYVTIKENNPIGAAAINFTQNNESDKPIALASFKGKYVLIDFWASWCTPCRAENPNIVAAYAKYKDKNFTILAVSLDKNKEKWLAAIQKDDLTWTHVSDLKGWENEAARLYSIKAIPDNLLLDPNGIIIAKNLNGEELEKKLAEILK